MGIDQVGAELEDVLRHARELLDLMREQFAAAGATVGEYAAGLLHEMADRLAAIE